MQVSVPQFDQVRVLVAGDVMLDRYWFGPTQRISPEAPVPVVHVRDTEERPGGAGNVAVNLASLGVRCTVLASPATMPSPIAWRPPCRSAACSASSTA